MVSVEAARSIRPGALLRDIRIPALIVTTDGRFRARGYRRGLVE
jgi:hypothetical protein